MLEFAAVVFMLSCAALIAVFARKLPYLLETDRLWKLEGKDE